MWGGAGDELPSSESDVLDITEFDLCALWRAGVFAVDCFVACLVPVRGTQNPPQGKSANCDGGARKG